MKKLYLIIVLVILTVVGFNIAFYKKFKRNFIDYQKFRLSQMVISCGSNIEKTIDTYENDIARILFNHFNELPEIFNNNRVFRSVSSDLQGLYSKNSNLISNISVYDNVDSYLGIYMKDNDEIVLDTFPRQFYNDLKSKETIQKHEGYYQSYFPFFKNNILTGNVVVEINLEGYLNSNFSLFQIHGFLWQWLASRSNQIMMCNYPDSISISDLGKISEGIKTEEEFVLEHNYTNSSGLKNSIISAVYPLNVLNNDLGIVFTLETGQLLNLFLKQHFIPIAVSLAVMTILIGFLISLIRIEKNRQNKRSTDLLLLKMIVEHFPVGIMITDSLGIIKNINRTGQKMLFLEKDDDLTGSKLNNQLMISNKYLLKDGITEQFDSNHFIHYEKKGNEVVIFRKDTKAQIAGEELTISALIDVSQLEKSRKQEAAANNAKSDFLEKMSHEIASPMNEILHKAETLLSGKLSAEQKEEVIIIRRASELLVTIINDILEFSKIGAEKMFLEEIPFNLKEELDLSISMFQSSAAEKGLELKINIHPEVPENIIGDPLRLRQVISNLISNAIKFTTNGGIIIGVNLIDRDESSLSLLFFVEDTGIGIPSENLKKIFRTYDPADNSISQKQSGSGLGITIAKQLVELMNGQIWVESPSTISTDSRFPGSRFNFTVEVNSNEKLKKKYNFSNIQKFHQITALVLSRVKDEDDTIHRLLDRFGINYNFFIWEEPIIESAISHVEQNTNLYNLIIILDKPGYDGFTIAQQLKESKLSDQFPVIMISSNDQPGNYVRSRSLGIDYYIINPFVSNEIYTIIKEHFQGLTDHKGILSQVNKIKSDLKILVAEDNIIHQRIAQGIFKRLGLEIDIARNGNEAVEMAVSKKYDIIFIDLLMPGLDGITATEELRKKEINVPVIAITSSDEPVKRAGTLITGLSEIVFKPLRIESIKDVLIKWCSEGI